MRFSAQELAALVDGEVVGDAGRTVTDVAPLDVAGADHISFISNPKYRDHARTSRAGIVLIAQSDLPLDNPNDPTLLVVDDAYRALAVLMQHKASLTESPAAGVHPTAFVHPEAAVHATASIGALAHVGANATVGDGAVVHAQAHVGRDVHIGDRTVLHPHATVLAGCRVGADCILHSGCVVGSDGFGFAPDGQGGFAKIPQLGVVVLEDEVEVGANTVVDRATMGRTLVARGAKLDNLVQVAHNVVIGRSAVVASQAGISGSTRLGEGVMVGGQAGFVGHITVADGVKVNAQSGVSKSIDTPDAAVTGSPAAPFRDHYRTLAMLRRLPELEQRLKSLEDKLS